MEGFSIELERLRGVILRPLAVFFALSLALLVLRSGEMSLGGLHVPMPVVGTPSLASEMFLLAKSLLVPPSVLVVALGPVSVFMAPLLMAFLISALITFPYMLYSVATFLVPALYPKERAIMYRFALPSLVLFYLGASFGFFFILPTTFSILYSFAAPMDITPFFSLDTFMSSVFLLTLSIGILFLLPVVMVVLTRLSVISSGQWLRNWRGAIFIAIVLCAVITPDGSGITMVLLFIPLVFLYGVGDILSR